jgi:glutamyl-tRNA synthetase
MRMRFDDTNPTKEKNEFVESIIEDTKTLGITWERLTYTSDYFDQLFELLRGLIKKGLAYCDNTPVEQMREERNKKIESPSRANSVEKNLEIYDLLLAGKANDYCVRAKIDMKSNNGAMRDPVMARPSDVPHQRTGTKYKVYPTYDFCCPVIDTLEGVTHVLRTNEYADRIPQFQWVLKALDFPPLEIYEYSRLNLEYTVLSKRKLNWFVDSGNVDGWNDPRFPTLRGVLRKGIRVETLIEFMLEQGPSKRANLMEWDKLWAINKRIIDPICPRYSSVSVDKACRLTVVNGPEEPEAVSVEMNKLNKVLGLRPLWKSKNLLLEF